MFAFSLVAAASPTFSRRSDTVSAIVGTDITLRCVATGQPEPLYEWMRDGRVVQSRNRLTVHAGSLTISSVSLQDTGRYDCVAENVVGRASKSIFLQVQGEQSQLLCSRSTAVEADACNYPWGAKDVSDSVCKEICGRKHKSVVLNKGHN